MIFGDKDYSIGIKAVAIQPTRCKPAPFWYNNSQQEETMMGFSEDNFPEEERKKWIEWNMKKPI